jgi:hypothetical protein
MIRFYTTFRIPPMLQSKEGRIRDQTGASRMKLLKNLRVQEWRSRVLIALRMEWPPAPFSPPPLAVHCELMTAPDWPCVEALLSVCSAVEDTVRFPRGTLTIVLLPPFGEGAAVAAV